VQGGAWRCRWRPIVIDSRPKMEAAAKGGGKAGGRSWGGPVRYSINAAGGNVPGRYVVGVRSF